MNIQSKPTIAKRAAKALAAILLIIGSAGLKGQAVSEIITDYNGYWKSSSAAVNSVKPDKSHNLLSFSFNGQRFSTGVNDALLAAHGETFTPGIFKALPMNNFNGTVISNTKIGLGAMADGILNGTSSSFFPSRNLATYLSDGVNGLDIGTCVANLPAGSMFLSVDHLQVTNIGDGVPDILVTQIADPSTTYDRYEFTDVNGNRVGNSLDIVLTNITPVANWIADFFEAVGSVNLALGFTQTPRAMRLWAADLSSFGIDASNIGSIAYFKITLSGDSDVAFVGYNTTTISVSSTLDLPAEIAGSTRITRSIDRTEPKAIGAYPNPARSSITVSHPAATGKERIMVYDMRGMLLLQTAVSKGTTTTLVNLPGLRPGSYQAVYLSGSSKLSLTIMLNS